MGREITELAMNSQATYEIKVAGKLTEQWTEWFNGIFGDYQEIVAGRTQTNLVCQVRDQAELIGILKQINALHLPLVQVLLINEIESQHEDF